MSPALTLVVLTLVSFRITRLLIDDTILDRPRQWVERKFMPRGGIKRRAGHPKLLELMGCNWCLGIYVSLWVVGVALWFMPIPYYVAMWVAVAAGQSLIYLVHDALIEWMNRDG